ncbi:MAG: universal stress protein [Pedobacter sp.]
METVKQTNLVKSLLVLTDFSQSAKNAADYAFNLAAKIKADIVLFNAYSIPDVGYDTWPMKNEGDLSTVSVSKLQEETIRLQGLNTSSPGMAIPQCGFLSSEGGIAESVNEIIEDRKDILMVIMGGGKCKGREDMQFGMEITKILVNVKCPTLIIPN